MQEWPVPTDIHLLRSFVGLATYYRKFVKGFSKISSPLTDLMSKNRIYEWTSEQDTAFETLKKALSTTLVLALPDLSLPFVVITNASDKALGAVLSQNQGKGDQLIAFESRKMTPAE